MASRILWILEPKRSHLHNNSIEGHHCLYIKENEMAKSGAANKSYSSTSRKNEKNKKKEKRKEKGGRQVVRAW